MKYEDLSSYDVEVLYDMPAKNYSVVTYACILTVLYTY